MAADADGNRPGLGRRHFRHCFRHVHDSLSEERKGKTVMRKLDTHGKVIVVLDKYEIIIRKVR